MKKITRHLEKMLAFVCLLGVSTNAWAAFTKTEKTFDTWDPTSEFDPVAANRQTAWVITGSGTAEELQTLIGDNAIRLLDLSDATITDGITSTAPFAGKKLTSVVLPKGISDVKAEWFTGCTELYAAVSYNEGVTELAAYVNKAGTLKNTFADIYQSGNTDLKSANQDGAWEHGGMVGVNMKSTITKLKLSGNLNAIDMSKDTGGGGSESLIGNDGHIAFNQPYKEEMTDSRTLNGTKKCGALQGLTITELDLEDAYFEDYRDMTLEQYGIYANLSKLVLPTDPRMDRIPAFMLRGPHDALKQICIPSNYKYIESSAFAFTSGGLDHIWTTPAAGVDAEHTIYDNGVVTAEENLKATETKYGYVNASDIKWGTYTFSSNLKCIDSYAFGAPTAHVKDVYNLALVAPECHVDAFNTKMYVGNNGYSPLIVNGIIERESYITNEKYVWITMLHYPSEAVTPNTQRYTDPQRKYSVATGLRDGKGGIIYFPTQAEFARAYEQGTYGYTWNAFDPTRNGYGGFLYQDGNEGGTWTTSQWSTTYQDDSNTKYNKYYERSGGANKNSVFYETGGEGVTITPKGLTNYWTLTWRENEEDTDHQLYPQAVIEEVEGEYVTVTKYIEDDNGLYVEETEERYVLDPYGKYVYAETYTYVGTNDPGWNNIPTGNYYVSDGNGKYIALTQQSSNDVWNLGRTNGFYQLSSGYREATDEDEALDHYSLQEIGTGNYVLATDADADKQHYTKTDVQEPKTVVKESNDYRGWHQFVLAATATNSNEPFTPLRSYITDNDWWTICSTFDMTREDLIRFYGGSNGELPYVSRLLYVVRNGANNNIGLFFSKNLMNFKYSEATENITVNGKTVKITNATIAEGKPAATDVVVKAGVPYMIRPNISADANRQFKVYQTTGNNNLYKRIVDAQKEGGDVQMQRIYDGLYTVPAYNINSVDESQEAKEYSVDYKGKTVTGYRSEKYSYTFVGSFYNSLLPQYAYFLGWVGDTDTGHAAFFFNRNQDKLNWRWTNETAIIMANWGEASGSDEINPATSLADPARWIVDAGNANNDDFVVASGSTSNRGAMDINIEAGDVTAIVEINNMMTDAPTSNNIYSIDGQYVGTSASKLAKGIYIRNNKKFIVK